MKKARIIIAAMLMLPLAAIADDTVLHIVANFTNTNRKAQSAQLYTTSEGQRGPVIDLTNKQFRRGTSKWNLSLISGFTFEKQVPTGIVDVNADNDDKTGTSFPVYGIDGTLVRKAAKSLDNLPKGIYIVKGKKIVVK